MEYPTTRLQYRAWQAVLLATIGLNLGLGLAPFAHGNAGAPKLAKPFSQEEEFPRFLLPRAYRNKAPDKIPAAVLAEVRKHFDAAIASILRRTTVPIIRQGESAPTSVKYFEFIQSSLEKLLIEKGAPAQVEVLASGGVVRSAIGLLYFEAYNAMTANPNLDTVDFLKMMASSTEPVSSLRVRGVGSDWDVLLRNYPEGWFGALQARVLEITNSAEDQTGMRYTASRDQDTIKRSVFAVADVKDYAQQTTRSTRQGGSSIDWLAFDVTLGRFVGTTGSPGHCRSPPHWLGRLPHP